MRIPPSHADAVTLSGSEFTGSPARLYARLREKHGPVAPVLLDGGVPAWIVLTHREIRYVCDHPHVFGRAGNRWNLAGDIPADWPLWPAIRWQPSVLHAEGADHERRSGVISDALTDVDLVTLTRICERTCDELIGSFESDGRADLVAQYGMPLPIRVVARLLDFPDDEVDAMAEDILTAFNQRPGSIEAYQRKIVRLTDLVRRHRADPGKGLIDAIILHRDAGSDTDIVEDLNVVLAPAHLATADWIATTLRLMLTDDGFSLALQGGRSGVPRALNEALWQDPPVANALGRFPVQQAELGGRRVTAGDLLILSYAAANADPAVAPGAFVGSSVNRAHLAFGYGGHGCPYGAPDIAEVIARIAVEVLLDRIPDVDLAAAPDDLTWRPSAWFRGLTSLPVTFTPVQQRPGS